MIDVPAREAFLVIQNQFKAGNHVVVSSEKLSCLAE